MEDILRPIYQERASHPNTLGIVIVEKKGSKSPLTDTFDTILFIIVKEADVPLFIKHYTYEENKAAMHIVSERQMKEWLLLGSNRKVTEWLLTGKIVFDRNEYIEKMRTELRDFPFYGRKIKMGIEFAKLIRRYMDGKGFFESRHFLDAYNHVVHSLHHLARLTVIENGFHPEVTVWNQVKQIEPEIFKLYEELVNSEETLEKRLELLFLASEFLIHSRIQVGSGHLLDVLSQKEAWTIQDLQLHEELQYYSVDLTVMIEFLIDKHVISTKSVETKGKGIYHRYYSVKKV
ncbi:nucleotidyltransferase-like protein [Jeotgalibacillus campisalis]|uniref:Nucleotidyltransferase-like domain-containing protein n=1 Tax=Jeotgalibacillus campisalis TaxID=220754 RepID=A0A0C2VRV8_9BACL|nr:nucleotidyltransferase-like protein [Jeotgalibacillus campisalis]KIL47181.1 hypothetical protein KR50_25030 [Jeotgalibacillus campisalis]